MAALVPRIVGELVAEQLNGHDLTALVAATAPQTAEGATLRGAIPIQPREWAFPRWPPQVAFGSDEAIEGLLLSIAPERETKA